MEKKQKKQPKDRNEAANELLRDEELENVSGGSPNGFPDERPPGLPGYRPPGLPGHRPGHGPGLPWWW